MTTARHLHDTGRHLASASGHLDAAREAPAGDPDDHIGRCAASLDGAHASAHHLAAHLRSHYPAEGADLDALTSTIGLARSVSDQAKTATTAHLTQTICNHLGHTIAHVKAMGDDPAPKVREFNWQHARTHLDGAAEHAGKLSHHLTDNYPAEGRHLAALKAGGSEGTVTAQLANRGYDLNPRSGMISLDLPPGTISPVPGGVADHHITVVYLGPDVDDDAFAQACKRSGEAALAMPGPLTGTAGGVGSFKPTDGSDGKVPAWAGVLLPGAERVREALEDLSASEHKHWKPHVTLAYVDPADPLPGPVPQTPVTFTHLSVHRGDDEVERFPFGAV
jgi:2'-5' RNA ligase